MIVVPALLLTTEISLAAPVVTVRAQLSANPATFSGYCPVTIRFSGSIEVSAPCTLFYRFIRSDGVAGPNSVYKFVMAGIIGRKNVSYVWQVSSSYSGWVAIEILSPVSGRSTNATFSVTCRPRPQINSVTLCSWPETNLAKDEVDLHGINFDEPPGKTRSVRCDGNPVFRSTDVADGFRDTLIWFGMLHSSVIFWDHTYQFAIEEDGAVISNVYSVRFPILVEALSPVSGKPGSVIEIWGGGYGASAGTKVLKMGSYVFNRILNWSDHTIRAEIPLAPPGTYEIYIQRGSEVISQKKSFNVIK